MSDVIRDINLAPMRVQILQEGAKITAGDRNKTYGEPIVNLGLAGSIKYLFWNNATRHIGPAEHEAIDNVIQKLARLARGNEPHRDTYVDGATYFAIAGEVAELEKVVGHGEASADQQCSSRQSNLQG